MKARAVLSLVLMNGLLAGAVSAQQTTTLPPRDRVLAGSPATLYTVGRAEGEDWEMLAGVTAVAFDEADNLYILDRDNHRVLVFDADGRFVRQIGRRGSGPGELQMPVGLAVTHDGRVVVSDFGRRALSVYDRSGGFITNVSFGDGWIAGAVLQAHPSGGVLTAPTNFVLPRSGAAAADAERPETQSIARLTLEEGATPQTILEVPVPRGDTRVHSAGGNTRIVIRGMTRMFAPTVRWTGLADGGIAVATDDAYAIRIAAADGTVQRVVTRNLRPRRVTERDKEAARAQRKAQLESGGGARFSLGGDASGAAQRAAGAADALLRAELDQMEFAETVPVIRALRADADGRIWVARQEIIGSDTDPIDLINARGEYVGTIVGQRLPAAFSARGRAAHIEFDALGVPRVRVVKLPESWR